MSEMEQYNILIVDEDEATRCTLADLLRGRDEYRVLVAGEGREAVRIFVEEARIDIVLTDIQMPEMNGLELVTAMKNDYPLIPVVLMTARATEGNSLSRKRRNLGSSASCSRLRQWLLASALRLGSAFRIIDGTPNSPQEV